MHTIDSKIVGSSVDATKFLELQHPGLQIWKKKMLACKKATTSSLLGFTPNIMQLIQSMSYEVFTDLNNMGGFEDIFIDISSREYPDVQPVDLLTILYRGDLSTYIFAQIREELFPECLGRDIIQCYNEELS